MIFSGDLREAVARGEVTVSVRLWRRPKVKLGGRCATCGVVIEIDSIEFLPFSALTDEDVRASGESDREALRGRAAHARPINDSTLVYRIEFPWHDPESACASDRHPVRGEKTHAHEGGRW